MWLYAVEQLPLVGLDVVLGCGRRLGFEWLDEYWLFLQQVGMIWSKRREEH